MENDTLIDKDVVSMRSSALVPKHEFALQFEPGTSVQHINEWVNHYVQQAQKMQGKTGSRAPISVNSMRIQEDGLVIVSGANVGEVAQLNAVKAQAAAAQMGTVFIQGEIQPRPKGPQPRIPADTIISKVKGIGQTVIVKNLSTKKIR